MVCECLGIDKFHGLYYNYLECEFWHPTPPPQPSDNCRLHFVQFGFMTQETNEGRRALWRNRGPHFTKFIKMKDFHLASCAIELD